MARSERPGADKIRRTKTTERPLKWLKEASPEEIGEALLTVGIDKAAAVVRYLIGRAGPELAEILETTMERLSRDPVEALTSAGLGALKGLSKIQW